MNEPGKARHRLEFDQDQCLTLHLSYLQTLARFSPIRVSDEVQGRKVMVAVFIAVLLFLSPVMPGFTADLSVVPHTHVSTDQNGHEDCDDSKPHTVPGQCCALQCLVFVAEAVAPEVRHVPSFIDVAYRQPVDHLTGVIFPPSLGPPRSAA